MRQVERGSGEWHNVWDVLAAALKNAPLPADGGRQVQCGIDDFMLMGVEDNGTAHFKNIVMRSYLLIGVDGKAVIPVGSFFASASTASVNYRIEQHGNCILVLGAVPVSKFLALTKLVPKNSVMDTHLARVAGASFAMGPREETKALVASMSGVAIEKARVLYADTGLSDDAVRWIAVGERGSSSDAIFYKLTGIRPHNMNGDTSAHPLDPDDLGRCRRLLEQVPELAARIGEMSSVSRKWAVLVAKWDEICRTMDDESSEWRDGKGSAPKAYAIMEECLAAGKYGLNK